MQSASHDSQHTIAASVSAAAAAAPAAAAPTEATSRPGVSRISHIANLISALKNPVTQIVGHSRSRRGFCLSTVCID